MSNCPARAGFTSATNGCAVRTRDHPRSRGVYETALAEILEHQGSSPLARGLRDPKTKRDEPTRIIPARAGFTSGRSPAGPTGPDHPRSRGVYASGWVARTSYPGSSPLARGLPRPPRPGRARRRIIPARAGFTRSLSPAARGPRDHPRSRGVYTATGIPSRCGRGSSPLARGLRRAESARPASPGIIPARAGFTRLSRVTVSASWDHPRSRGVYLHDELHRRILQGSSPLARGLRGRDRPDRTHRGIIPARAGFTTLIRADDPDYEGSSPLARGLPRRWRRGSMRPRIIPARAGFTRRSG